MKTIGKNEQEEFNMKKILSVLLLMAMVTAMFPMGIIPVFAAQSGDYTYIIADSKAKITKYFGKGGIVTIPSKLGGYQVTEIGGTAYNYMGEEEFNGAFENCSKMTGVTIPDSVTTITENAFKGCAGLTTLTIPNSVTNIGWFAFADCTGLKCLNIPNSVTNLGNYTFAGCTGLKSINISNRIKSIGQETFSSCSGLEKVTIPNSVTDIGSGAFEFCSNLTDVTIPNSVTSIGYRAFYYSGLAGIAIPNSVVSIGEDAFNNCNRMKSITVPNTVKRIGVGAFMDCDRLNEIIVDSKNRSFSSKDGVLFNKLKTSLIQFPNGKTGAYVIPGGVIEIGEFAFDSCKKLTAVTIPDSVRMIDNYNFYYCSGLTSVTIGRGVKNLDNINFFGCKSLTQFIVDSKNLFYSSHDGVLFDNINTALIRYPCNKKGNYIIPDNITNIGEEAFRDCTGLTSLTIPKSVTSIGRNILINSSALKEIVVDINNTIFSSRDGVLFDKTITSLIQYPCGKSGEYTVPESVAAIESGAFSFCGRLTKMTLGSHVKFGDYDKPFTGCDNLTQINVNQNNNSYSSLDGVMFNKAKTSLLRYPNGRSGQYVIPDSVNTIGYFAFSGCNKLTTVTIPSSVTFIDYAAFYGCTNLKKAYFFGNAPSIAMDDDYCTLFYDAASGFKVYYISGNTGFFDTWNRYSTTTFGKPVTSVKLNATTLKWPVGKSGTFKVTLSPSDATNKDVTWKSGNTKVATVDSSGKVTAVGAGNTIITCSATGGNKTVTCKITVTPAR